MSRRVLLGSVAFLWFIVSPARTAPAQAIERMPRNGSLDARCPSAHAYTIEVWFSKSDKAGTFKAKVYDPSIPADYNRRAWEDYHAKMNAPGSPWVSRRIDVTTGEGNHPTERDQIKDRVKLEYERLESQETRPFDVKPRPSEEPELVLPSAPSRRSFPYAQEAARWDEEDRKVGVDLSRRKENGPIRCTMKVRPGAASRKEPELEIELKNVSDKPTVIKIHEVPLDAVTFIFRDPEDNVVSSLSSVVYSSDMHALRSITLGPGEAKVSKLSRTIPVDRGSEPLKPGLYSLEAVFHEHGLFDPLGPSDGMFARSDRVPVRVK